MGSSIIRRAVLGAALASGLVAGAAAQEVRNYAVQGTNADGSAYAGSLALIRDGAASYRVRWVVSGSTIDGVAMSAGNILSAAYVLNGKVGLAIYQIMPDGRLSGQWTLQGARGVGTETLIPR